MSAKHRYAVIGYPVAHSLSPQIHRLFAEQCSINLSYERIETSTEFFVAAVDKFFSRGGVGLNVTLPFKQQALEISDLLSNRALSAGAVNTLKLLDGGLLYGDNTDGAGLVNDMHHNLDVHLSGTTILLLGAGGAVRGCLPSIMQQQPKQVYIHNRTREKAEKLVASLDHYDAVSTLPKEKVVNLNFDIVINGTSTSVSGHLPNIDHRYLRNAICYDMMYGDAALPFIKWCITHGAKAAYDGIGMLVEQAAESFLLWHEVQPSTPSILQQLRKNKSKVR